MTAERPICARGIANRLLRYAAGRAPEGLAERLEEEWQADMAQREGQWSRLRFAIGCCWATTVIAREHGLEAIPVSAAGRQLVGYLPEAPFSPGATTFLLVAGLHAAILFGLITMHSTFLKTSQPNITVRMVDKVPTMPPPLPPPRLLDTRIQLGPREDLPTFEAPAEDTVQTVMHEPIVMETATQALSPAIRRMQGGPGSGFPSAEDFYPSVSVHMGEQGVVTVRACVDAKGMLTDEPVIAESSGSRRLDEGALRLARAGSGHYRASREDDRPVASCYPFRIRFSLK